MQAARPECRLPGAPKRFEIVMMGGRSGSLGNRRPKEGVGTSLSLLSAFGVSNWTGPAIKLFRPTRSRVAKTRLELLVRVIMV